ncbi:metal ABC transporter permease [Hoyosella rhizosphaerae]|uniref:ABC-transporter transmembrane protein n=1 Tax=Hoyosella rhizosphaerae TaxID=1755582 RepID=A0A916UJW2_9ACTN|nr:metal ABC transporter permease [Hoyosella rhizosphaerae]MBN4928370.1 metal ABC transporter permease [Hoyosella rhizosphaerae]GGC74424.1 putative ABC-transporter transmembrane protein [Hoyosella rhizosphaerae]
MYDFWVKFFDFTVTADLLSRSFVQHAIIASAILGLLAGVIGPLIVSRQMSFAVHGTSELSVMGAAGGLLLGISVGYGAIVGSIAAALLFGILGLRSRERDAIIGVILSFGLGLAVLFLWLNPDRTVNQFALLVGQVVTVNTIGLQLLIGTAVVVLVILAAVYRPLLFASTDPEVASARGIPVRGLSIVFAVLVGLAVSIGVQIVGALLVLSLLVTPAAAAGRLTADPLKVTIFTLIFAQLAAVGGIILSLAPGVPVSVFVTSIAFVIYVICRIIGSRTTAAAA